MDSIWAQWSTVLTGWIFNFMSHSIQFTWPWIWRFEKQSCVLGFRTYFTYLLTKKLKPCILTFHFSFIMAWLFIGGCDVFWLELCKGQIQNSFEIIRCNMIAGLTSDYVPVKMRRKCLRSISSELGFKFWSNFLQTSSKIQKKRLMHSSIFCLMRFLTRFWSYLHRNGAL